jgi:addiction module HigA family antidote
MKAIKQAGTASGSTISIVSHSAGSRAMPTKSASKIITRDPNWQGPAIAPGEVLLEEFLKPLALGQVEASRRLGISLNRLNEIVLGKRRITADTALRVARLFEMSPQFRMRLQADWDLHQALQRERRKAS